MPGSGDSKDIAIVGLGNPGQKYQHTRHNIGFMVVDLFASGHSVKWAPRFRGEYGSIAHSGFKVHLLKPSTFMNLSGESVRELVQFFKIETESVLIVQDELDLEWQGIKFAKNGGEAGHNGIKSIYQHIGKNIWRLKVGIGRPPEGFETADYVLSKFQRKDEKDLEEILQTSVSAIESFVTDGVEKAMNRFNRKRIKAQ